jgi:hypothetical protein
MAGYGKAGATIRIGLLMLIIFILVTLVGPFVFRTLGLPVDDGGFFALVTRPFGITPSRPHSDPALPSFIADERLAQQTLVLAQREFAMQQRVQELDDREEGLNAREEALQSQEKELREMQETLTQRVSSFDNLESNLIANAERLYGMPPAQAVQILSAMVEDEAIVDHLRASDTFAASRQQASLTSVWLSMMDPMRAAVIANKMAMP